MASGELTRTDADRFQLYVDGNAGRVCEWLHALSDGYALLDEDMPSATLPGPVRIKIGEEGVAARRPSNTDLDTERSRQATVAQDKAFFVGGGQTDDDRPALPVFDANLASVDMLMQTPLHSLHQQLGAKLAPFAGYEMPLWYKSVSAEHAAVRESAGVFDVAHMGVLEVSGAGAARFLHQLTSNDALRLRVGRSNYGFLLDVDGGVLDDLLVYRLDTQRYMAVVNASNNAKIWAWLNAVHAGEVMIDRRFPARKLEGRERVQLRDLRAPSSGADRRVDIALQGPRSRDILLQLLDESTTPRRGFCPGQAS